jgi:hypothetical protein
MLLNLAILASSILVVGGLASYLFGARAHCLKRQIPLATNKYIFTLSARALTPFLLLPPQRARYLLIPEDKLNEKLKEEWVEESQDPIPELAEEFQVSEKLYEEEA